MSARERRSWGSEGGWTILELLAAVALTGVIATVTAAFLPTLWKQVEEFRAVDEELTTRWRAVATLRADIHRARRATVADGTLVLTGEEGEVRWGQGPDGLERRAGTGRRTYPPEGRTIGFRLAEGARGRLVVYELGGDDKILQGAALVGRTRGTR